MTDIYQKLGYVYLDEPERFVYTSKPGGSTPWSSAYYACKSLVGELLVPLNQSEWEWMKETMINKSYSGMWLPIKECGEDQNTYYWTGFAIHKSLGEYTIDRSYVWENVTQGTLLKIR